MKFAIERRPLFPLGQLVATPGALAASLTAGQSPAEFFPDRGRYPRGRSPGERAQLGARIPAPEQLPNERQQRSNLGGS